MWPCKLDGAQKEELSLLGGTFGYRIDLVEEVLLGLKEDVISQMDVLLG